MEFINIVFQMMQITFCFLWNKNLKIILFLEINFYEKRNDFKKKIN